FGDEAAVTRLLGATPSDDALRGALAGAAKGGHVALCRRLIGMGAPVSGAIGRRQVTPLMCAAYSGSLPVVALLVESGADLQPKSAGGCTALDLATGRNHAEVARFLRERTGAPPA